LGSQDYYKILKIQNSSPYVIQYPKLSQITEIKTGLWPKNLKLSRRKIFLDFCFPVNLTSSTKKNYEQKN